MDLLASSRNLKIPGSINPLADAANALVALWSYFCLIYGFPPLKLLPHRLR